VGRSTLGEDCLSRREIHVEGCDKKSKFKKPRSPEAPEGTVSHQVVEQRGDIYLAYRELKMSIPHSSRVGLGAESSRGYTIIAHGPKGRVLSTARAAD
jgi:hypothetical protein